MKTTLEDIAANQVTLMATLQSIQKLEKAGVVSCQLDLQKAAQTLKKNKSEALKELEAANS